MKRWQMFGRRFWRYGGIAVCMALLVVGLLISPGTAQTQTPAPSAQNSALAPVVLDGRVLFRVRNLNSLTAEQRAAIIHTALQWEVRSPEESSVVIVRENGNVVLKGYPSDRNLLTVTEQDITNATTPYGQAMNWQGVLQDAIRQGQLERAPTYQQQAMVYAGVVLAIAAAIQLFLWFIGRWGARRIRRWLEANHTPIHTWRDSLRIVWKLALLGLEIGLWTAVLLYVTDLFPQARMARYNLWGFLNARVITLGTSNYSALHLLLLLGLTAGLWFGISTLTRLFRFYIMNPAGVNPRIQDVVTVLLQYALTFLGLIILLQIWGLDVSSLAILASVLGVGIGFGIQNITNNFISGFIITLERPIEVGDFIKVGELTGIVDHIGARSTKIRTLDQVTIIVPNSRFLESEVINWSHGDPVCRMHLSVGLAYGSNLDQAKTALLEAARRHPDVLLRPRPEVWFQGFDDSSLKFDLFVWTGDPKRQFKVKSDLYYEIEASLKRHNLHVPFPQQDLHVRSPQLDRLVDALAHAYGLPPEPETNGQTARSPLTPSDRSLAVEDENQLTEPSLSAMQALVNALHSEDGLPIGDRQYQSQTYPRCFTGSELVSWLVEKWNCTREDAMQWGQDLLTAAVIDAVMGESTFHDGYYFYRFREEQGPDPQRTLIMDAIAPSNEPSGNPNEHANVARTEGEPLTNAFPRSDEKPHGTE